ncbi:PEP/pyruvate-binding domain-containing protein [Thermodesulfobacteriota bacterium]
MKTTYLLSEISPDSKLFGGKATALRRLQEAGLRLPSTLCISTEAYKQYVNGSSIREKIQLELHRKKFSDMRWEEVWDAALRIRNLFLRQRMPEKLAREISAALEGDFSKNPLVVRSSAPEEDAAATSFAGLHESFVNIRGTESILEHVKLVWASLWSDRALLYRQELDLDFTRSSMAVVMQELVAGEVSGITFSINPADSSEGVVEAVYGLNQGLVDGAVEPDRWIFNRKEETTKEHYTPRREKFMTPRGDDIILTGLPESKSLQPPLSNEEAVAIYRKAKQIENVFGKPQDVEWTRVGSDFFILQSRPVTARQDGDKDDKRGWYLSLQRSEDNLKKLRLKIEQVHFPAMKKEAAELAETDLEVLSDKELAGEIEKRLQVKGKWTAVYWEDFIPFAHGMRLFGKFYNDTVSPADPFEFVELLSNVPLLSKNRNKALRKIGAYVQQQTDLLQAIAAGGGSVIVDAEFTRMLEEFINLYGDPFCGTYSDKTCDVSREELLNVIIQMAGSSIAEEENLNGKEQNKADLEAAFFEKLKAGGKRARAEGLLDLARASYRLRDDDNIVLGRIEEQFFRALQEGRKRLKERHVDHAVDLTESEVIRSLVDRSYKPDSKKDEETPSEQENRHIKARQLLGQPAGPGIGRGLARIIDSARDLGLFKKGEVLVCDAVDPNMTFVVPLAAGIIERRGGMLIHGAIIAREYGIACVTGVPDAATLIHTGDEVTVDGYLGIVTVGQKDSASV